MKSFLKVLVLCGSLACTPAFATQLFTNGGFELGSLLDWNVAGTAGSGDNFFADNTDTTPDNGFPTIGPFAGSWYAVSDSTATGPANTTEKTSLTQTLTIPVGTTDDVLSFEMFVNDYFAPPSGGTGGEVAIWANGANPLTATPLYVVYGPIDNGLTGGEPNPYIAESVDVTAHLTAGTTYVIGVLESDTTGPISVGVDNFSLVATNSSVPEPAMLFPTALLAAGLFIYRARRKVRAQI
jgi:hypothetical protein